ncbi:MAG: AbrB/MazE/SpoVT family DNA-binding domain-containing protein [Sphingomonadaceae bacterium]|nr:AbrB/MazE/SpoVT family DNA-binding domain-containing protein [Sphingomonadaceae bacterium]
MEMSKLTSKHQATVPADVRAALGLKGGDTIEWVVDKGGARVRKARGEDLAWLRLAEESFAVEWLSDEDEEAFCDL